ncbi:hypothetical protein A2982_01870 [candidate division WWE3 bacterium RIFCSPLOWO2_01_FULL_39_13]|uniref:Solute-binding protein family 3/N-terminal domain-containing protein n=1 Tax=candidate division WWE3 bacterium RIFCSPLOWO2_01_FULL_39_13 TaxID=1802624 RepID=A0A1F4V5B8_UNCKA|nr:MAG: hypothetical protein A2982_01870 [candidate division WWE3 bacterium RIFCSPLOWO2_01_FULL_39_13]
MGNTTETSDPEIQRIKSAGKIIIGTDATFAPMEFIDTNGNVTGYDIDLGNKIAEEFGVKPEFVNVPWDNIFDNLNSGKVDLIISSVTINEERKKLYDFSDGYLNAGQVIITHKGNNSIKSVNDLKNKKIAVQKGTTNEEQALLYTQEQNVLRYDDFIQATEALNSKKADAIFADLTVAKGIIDENPGLKIASDPFTSDTYGIVFRKNSDDLVEKTNQTLQSLRQRGFLVYIKQKWLE